jgi:hypothetical protein
MSYKLYPVATQQTVSQVVETWTNSMLTRRPIQLPIRVPVGNMSISGDTQPFQVNGIAVEDGSGVNFILSGYFTGGESREVFVSLRDFRK